jgi:membrane fusion protein (multidrug efflux system)
VADGLLSRIRRSWLIAGAVVVALVVAYFGWRYIFPRESTDDAQVAGHVSPVAARVGGTIKAIHVVDNQVVKAGDVLVEIDPRDYELALAKAKADLAAAEARSRVARTGVPVTSTTAKSELRSAEAGSGNAEAALKAADREVDAGQAKVASAKAHLEEVMATATKAQQDLDRLKPLAAKQEIPTQQLDAATAAATSAKATVNSAQAAVNEAEANLNVSEAHRDQASGALTQAQAQAKAASTAPQQIAVTEAQAAGADAEVLQAQAAVEMATLNLERATVRAPADGLVSRKSIELGQVIQPGQSLMSITTLNDVWIVANFKETQLDGMHPGQRAEIEVDAYGSQTFTGKVDSISAATGSTFSLLPPENATGNFVKVVQRVPVKILLEGPADPNAQLRPGMSVTATVYLR